MNKILVNPSVEHENPVTMHLEPSQWQGRTVDFRQNEVSLKLSLGLSPESTEDRKPAVELFSLPVATKPLSLKAIPGNNYTMTGCYLTSVVELMLSQNHIRRQLFAEMLKIKKLKGEDPVPKAKNEKQTAEKEIKENEENPVSEKEQIEKQENLLLQIEIKKVEEEIRVLLLKPMSRNPEINRNDKLAYTALRQKLEGFKQKVKVEQPKPNPKPENLKLKPKTENIPTVPKDPRLEALEKKEAILKALLDLIVDSNQGKVALPGEPMRRAICQSGLNFDLNLETLYEEHDAAEVLRLLMDDFLNTSFQTRATDRIEGGQTFNRPIQTEFSMGLPILEGTNSLAETLAFAYSELPSRNSRLFEIDGKKHDLYFNTRSQILTMPETLGIQLLRFDLFEKKNNALTLPADGIVDLSAYYGGENYDSCKYEITGYINHRGFTRETGHYTVNVKIGEKYFECDDATSSFKEISKADFYGNTNSYLILLKKIPVTVEEIVSRHSLEQFSKME